ncbi:CDP-alcohol phosphatidyltransferase family protein [Taklimakanibacter lacteus]|uniref:CDP-alcohol phosphatidyltransferase family protein n=1 Tax=Taklimakanibacter lacteus TaxID=2268456 RepID=UPI000E660BB1
MHGPLVKPILDVFLVGETNVAVFSMSQRERLRRSLAGGGTFVFHDGLDEACAGGHALVVRDDWVIEKRILQALISGDALLLKDENGGQPVYIAAYVPAESLRDAAALLDGQPAELPASLKDIRTATPARICGSFEGELRKRGAPVAAKVTEEARDRIERSLFQSSYKGATDFITKYLWPEPALIVVRALARYGVTPNVITMLSLICVVATFYCFWIGAFWWGVASAFMMAFLDTVDGKLARVTLTATRAGHLFDHGIDLISPPFWWAAWFAGLLGTSHASTDGFQTWGWPAFWIIMANYWLVRGVEALFVKTFRFNIHIWKPMDFAFRLVTTRRNVNITILAAGLLVGRPDLGFIAVALWSIASLVYHAFRFCQALLRRTHGGPIQSFLA